MAGGEETGNPDQIPEPSANTHDIPSVWNCKFGVVCSPAIDNQTFLIILSWLSPSDWLFKLYWMHLVLKQLLLKYTQLDQIEFF